MNNKLIRISFFYILVFFITFYSSDSYAIGDAELIKNKINYSYDSLYFYNTNTETVENIIDIKSYAFIDIDSNLVFVAYKEKSVLSWNDYIDNTVISKLSSDKEIKPYDLLKKNIDKTFYDTLLQNLLKNNKIPEKSDLFIVYPIADHFYSIYFIISGKLRKAFCYRNDCFILKEEFNNSKLARDNEDLWPYELKNFKKISECEGLLICNDFNNIMKNNNSLVTVKITSIDDFGIKYQKHNINISDYYFIDDINVKFIKKGLISYYFNSIISSEIFLQYNLINNNWEISFTTDKDYTDMLYKINISDYIADFDKINYNVKNYDFKKTINDFLVQSNRFDYDFVFYTSSSNDIIKLYRINSRNIKIYYLLKKSSYYAIDDESIKKFINRYLEYSPRLNIIKISNRDLIKSITRYKDTEIIHKVPKNEFIDLVSQFIQDNMRYDTSK